MSHICPMYPLGINTYRCIRCNIDRISRCHSYAKRFLAVSQEELSGQFNESGHDPPPRGVLPYISYVGMYHPKGYGF